MRLLRASGHLRFFLLALVALGYLAACSSEPHSRTQLVRIAGKDDNHRKLQIELNGEPQEYEVSADSDVFAPDARLIVQSGDHIEERPISLKVFTKKDGPERVAVLVDENEQIKRAIITNHKDTYEVTPGAVAGSFNTQRDSELPLVDAECGVKTPPPVGSQLPREGLKLADEIPTLGGPFTSFAAPWEECSPANTKPMRLNMGIAMDLGQFKALGSSEAAAQERIATMVLRSNGIYSYQLNVVLTVKTIHIQKAPGGPEWNVDNTSATCPDINTRLNTFTSWQASNVVGKAGLAQGNWALLTSCYAPAGTVGLAWIGTLCSTRYATAVVHANNANSWKWFAHEVGHNFGGQHAFGYGGIMDYGDGTVNGVYQFAEFNRSGVCTSLSSGLSIGQKNGCFEPYLVAADTTPPTAPSALVAKAVSGGISLSWQAATDNTGVAKYDVYRDSVRIATVTTLSYTDTKIAASTKYTYHVTASDQSGNNSPPSSAATITTPAPSTTTGGSGTTSTATTGSSGGSATGTTGSTSGISSTSTTGSTMPSTTSTGTTGASTSASTGSIPKVIDDGQAVECVIEPDTSLLENLEEETPNQSQAPEPSGLQLQQQPLEAGAQQAPAPKAGW